MKKLLSITLFSFLLIFGINFEAQADGEIELYPYDQEACLLKEAECLNTKVGDSHWSVNFNGNIYHTVSMNVRYVSELVDADANGKFTVGELSGLGWGSFGLLTLNNTMEDVIMDTANNRADLTGNAQWQQIYWDENGDIVMIEDSVYSQYIYNDGTVEAPDWRLATQAEIDAYEAEVTAETTVAGEPSVDGLTRHTTIRTAVSDTDTDGYVIEPIPYLKWHNADVVIDPLDPAYEADVTKWSTIVAGDPYDVYLDAGWNSLGLAYWDRAGNTKIQDWIKGLPAALATGTTAPAVFNYDNQPGWLNNLSAQDDDPTTNGVNIVVDYNSVFDLPIEVEAEWRNMFDDTDPTMIINMVEKLDYTVEISQDETLLETITFTWDETNTIYVASAAQTAVDSSDFGAQYTAEYKVMTPEGDEYSKVIDIVVGVFPPLFSGVEDKYVDQGLYIDLMEGITADDGYGNDVTSTIMLTTPADFNTYSPMPGTYEFGLEFTHHVHFDGVDPTVTLNGTEFIFNGDTNVSYTDWDSSIAVYTDVTELLTTTMSWGSSGVIIEVAGDGTVIRTVDRHNWDLNDSTGFTAGGASGMFDAWFSGLTLEPDGFIVIVGYKLSTEYAAAKALVFGDPIAYDLTVIDDFDYDIITTESFTVTVDDTMAPVALVLNDEYMITEGDYMTADDAILANVAAFDFTDSSDDLAIYVSSNGGLLVDTAGTYTVEVTVEDIAGNSAIVEFDVVVMAAPDMFTEAEAQAMVDAAVLAADTLTEAEIQALLDAQTITQAEIQALIDDATAVPADTGCGSAIGIGSVVTLMVAILGGGVIFFVRKNH